MMTPLKYTKGLIAATMTYSFKFENGHLAFVKKTYPHDTFDVVTTCELFGDKNVTNEGVKVILEGLSKMPERKIKNGSNK